MFESIEILLLFNFHYLIYNWNLITFFLNFSLSVQTYLHTICLQEETFLKSKRLHKTKAIFRLFSCFQIFTFIKSTNLKNYNFDVCSN